MKRKRLFWQIFTSYLLVAITALLAVTWYASRSMREFYIERLQEDLAARIELLTPQFSALLAAGKITDLQQLSQSLGQSTTSRLTIILPDGTVIADTEHDPRTTENHSNRPEVQQALAGHTGTAIRYSHTVQRNMLYVARSLAQDTKPSGVLRMSLSLAFIEEALKRVYLKIFFGGCVITLLLAFLSLVLSRRLSRPLEELKQEAERFAIGDLSVRLSISSSEEIGSLAQSMNRMAEQLQEKLNSLVQQRNEQEAILASMVEGVFAFDTQERLLNLNRAAAALFEIDTAQARGLPVQEIIRNTQLHRFLAKTISSQETQSEEIIYQNSSHGEERFLQLHGSMLRDPLGRSIGALIVVNDVTQMRKLENIRRDFVANVSHELKTPITSIKGFVETLLDGADESKEDRLRFLQIISRHTDRLNAIIEDLLSLSRIEQEAENSQIALEPTRLKEVLHAAAQVCQVKAGEKRVRLITRCDDDLSASASPHLLEQAVVNLIDNAVKYSEADDEILVEAADGIQDITISVTDCGSGIDEVHLPRLFERFYRVDKARSRKLGGTGLGLAIVKHITQAHGGWVGVKSTPGEGSQFTLHLPKL